MCFLKRDFWKYEVLLLHVCVCIFTSTIKVGSYEIGSLQKERACFRWEVLRLERSMESVKSCASLLVADDSLK